MLENKTRKLVVALAGVFLVVAMTGIAAAENMVITDPPSTDVIPGGPAITYTITMSDFLDMTNEHTIYANVLSGTASDLQFQFVWSTGSSGWLNSGTSWNWGPPSANTDTLTLNVQAVASPTDPVGTTYIFRVYDSDGAYDGASATTKSVSIPEFATVAIPMAIAILGGLFFLNHRKRREE